MSRHLCSTVSFDVIGRNGRNRGTKFGDVKKEGGTTVWRIEEESWNDKVKQIHVEGSSIGRDSWNNRQFNTV